MKLRYFDVNLLSGSTLSRCNRRWISNALPELIVWNDGDSGERYEPFIPNSRALSVFWAWVISVMKPPAWKPRQNFDLSMEITIWSFWTISLPKFENQIVNQGVQVFASHLPYLSFAVPILQPSHESMVKLDWWPSRLWQGGGQVDRNWKIIVVDSGQCQRGHVVREHTFTIRLLSDSCTSAPSLPRCAVTNTFQNFSDLRHLFRVGLIQYHDHEVQNEMC